MPRDRHFCPRSAVCLRVVPDPELLQHSHVIAEPGEPHDRLIFIRPNELEMELVAIDPEGESEPLDAALA